MGSDLVAKFGVLATTFIAVRALPPVRFGQFIALSATAFLAAWLWDAGVASVITREIAAHRATVRGAVGQAARHRIKLFPLWLLTFAIGALIINRAHSLSTVVIIAFGAASAVFSAHAVTLALLRAELRFAAAGIATLSGRCLTAFASLASLRAPDVDSSLRTLVVAFLAGESLTLAFSIVALARSATFKVPPTGSERSLLSLRKALPFNANNLLLTAYNRLDVVILTGLSSAAQLALYAPASRLQDALFLIPSSLGLIAFPYVSMISAQGRMDELRRLIRTLVIVGLAFAIPVALIVTLMTPAILGLVLGPGYVGATTATRILTWSLPFAVVEAPLLAALMGTGHATETTKVYVGAFLAAMGMHLCLDWWWGATGGAVASLSREPIALLILVIIAKRVGVISTPMPFRPGPISVSSGRTAP